MPPLRVVEWLSPTQLGRLLDRAESASGVAACVIDCGGTTIASGPRRRALPDAVEELQHHMAVRDLSAPISVEDAVVAEVVFGPFLSAEDGPRGGLPDDVDDSLVEAFPLLDADAAERVEHHVALVAEAMSDIAETTYAERHHARRLADVLRSVREGVLATGSEGRIEFVNPFASELLGIDPWEARGRRVDEILGPEVSGSETCVICTDGQRRHVDIIESPLLDARGTIAGSVLTLRDVSRTRELEAQLRQAQKMESIGRLAGGIAHDFNNLLAAVLGYAEMGRERVDDRDVAARALNRVHDAASRAVGLTKKLLAFSRKQVLDVHPLRLEDSIADIVPLLEGMIGEDVSLRTEFTSDERSHVRADPFQLQQILMNLAVNARDAMPAGGTLWIRTEDAHVDDEFVACHPGALPGPHVVLTVSDNGMGMDEATVARIFEPFFTTKGESQGTGLGLSTIYGIVKQHDGYIDVESAPGRGTRFRIHLPRIERAPAEHGATAERGLAPCPIEGDPVSVLVVEDEDALRGMLCEMLDAKGYVVHEASLPEQALEIASSFERPCDVLLTDVIMPRMRGPDLAEILRQRWPSLRVIYMSGYTGAIIEHHGLIPEGTPFLQKPFSFAELLETVARTVSPKADEAARRRVPVGATSQRVGRLDTA